jgi:hypothetical protein
MARKQKVMLAAVLMGVAGRMCSVAIAADAPQTKGRVEAVTV